MTGPAFEYQKSFIGPLAIDRRSNGMIHEQPLWTPVTKKEIQILKDTLYGYYMSTRVCPRNATNMDEVVHRPKGTGKSSQGH